MSRCVFPKNSCVPHVMSDPRFYAGKRLLQVATTTTNILVDSARRSMASRDVLRAFIILYEHGQHQFGSESVEMAPIYFEYGNALLRLARYKKDTSTTSTGITSSSSQHARSREAAAAAALKRFQGGTTAESKEDAEDDDGDKKPAAFPSKRKLDDSQEDMSSKKKRQDTNDDLEGGRPNYDEDGDEEENDDKDDSYDLKLSLELMENAFAILDKYVDDGNDGEHSTTGRYMDWARTEISRVLSGVGDVLSELYRHADAADAYSRALEFRKGELVRVFGDDDGGEATQDGSAAAEASSTSNKGRSKESVDYLRARRLLVEAHVLVAEAILACPPGIDVATTETKAVLCKASERVKFARGCFDDAEHELGELLALLERLQTKATAAGGTIDSDLDKEVQNVSMLPFLVRAVEQQLDDEGQ